MLVAEKYIWKTVELWMGYSFSEGAPSGFWEPSVHGKELISFKVEKQVLKVPSDLLRFQLTAWGFY